MKRLSKEQILMLHSQLIEVSGGSDGVRDYNLLDSALESPFQSFGGEDLYPTVQAKGVRLGYGLIKNHCMVDGNKRIGTHAMLVFLALNGIELEYTQKELYETILSIRYALSARAMKSITAENYQDMRNRVQGMDQNDHVDGSSNFVKLIEKLGTDNIQWIDEINDKIGA